MKLRVLAFADYYLPGFKGGGPAQSISRIVDSLSGELEFAIFTRDRDLGEETPYADVAIGAWSERDGVRYFYARPDQLKARQILAAIREIDPDVIYLNSYFSRLTRTVLLLRLFGLLGKRAILIAPRGEFSKGALGLKAAKKRLYLKAATWSGLHRQVTWQVSSTYELADTRAVVDHHPDYFIKAPDLVHPRSPEKAASVTKEPGVARFAFLSRISPMKNLAGAIRMLADVQGSAIFTIYGPSENAAYQAECEETARSLPPDVTCIWAGPVPPDAVATELSRHHFFLLPTLGENFGHVVVEALGAGCPVLLSDRTPWKDLDEQSAGWVLPLEEPGAWQHALQRCLDMEDPAYQEMRRQARAYVARLADPSAELDASRRMF
ncbi:MAG TPA: glycosyltransferase family 4 protein, partial [Fimbriimonadaceae bacterium]|nr:glycosyltransferase family 4 protein [Fimbriimonadaceae bacterium]